VALLIIKAANDLTVQSARDVLESSFTEGEETWIRSLIYSHIGFINGYHAIRTRKVGHFRFVKIHIQVEAQTTVAVSHELTRKLCKAIKERPADRSTGIARPIFVRPVVRRERSGERT
jgi:divalent metal cation (Fe/Co/Zn/Cd) transporter